MDVARTRQELEKLDPELAELIQQIPHYDPWLLNQPGMYFDVEQAWFALEWIPEYLRFVKGPKAGQPFELDWWQAAIVACLWGFRNEDGTRRFNTCFLYVGKKQGKSAFSAAVAALMMATDGEQGMELYAVASNQRQTDNVFKHLSGMIRQQPAFAGRWRILGNRGGTARKKVVDYESMSAFEVLCSDADSVDGAEPNLNIIDELHRHKTGELMDVLRRSGRSVPNHLSLITTTAATAGENACNDELQRARNIRENQGDPAAPGYSPSYLPCIWEAWAPGEDPLDYTDEEVWYLANPGLGTVKSLEGMRESLQEVRDTPSKLNDFLRLDLNVVTAAARTWLDPNAWAACEPERTIDQVVKHLEERERALVGSSCWMGVDLSRKIDQTALCLWFPEARFPLMRYWIPEETARRAEEKHGIPYSLWARHGLITIVPGGIIEYDLVEGEIQKLNERHDVQDVGYDPWKFERLRQNVLSADTDIEMTAMKQGARTLGEATVEFEGMVVDGSLNHGGHPVLAQNARNATIRTDANLNIMPCKKSSKGPIDGILALVMAIAGAILNPAGPSLDEIYSSGETLEA